MGFKIDLLIITPLQEERDAIVRKFDGFHRLPPFEDDSNTYLGTSVSGTREDGSSFTYHVANLTLLGMGRVEAAAATTAAINTWRPNYVIVTGIAGGYSNAGVGLGDILVPSQFADYELQKLRESKDEIRWSVHRADARLLSAAAAVASDDWESLLDVKRPRAGQSVVHDGIVLTGDKVDARGQTEEYREIYAKAVGVEMEVGGVAVGAANAPSKPGVLMVRGVSDLADPNKDTKDTGRWRSYASDVAAAFTAALIKSGPLPSVAGSTHQPLPHENSSANDELIQALRERLKFLKLRDAKAGWDAPTALKMEIKEVEAEIQRLTTTST